MHYQAAAPDSYRVLKSMKLTYLFPWIQSKTQSEVNLTLVELLSFFASCEVWTKNSSPT